MDRSHAHPTGGDGAGLVENNRVDPAGGLQDLRALDQDAQLGPATGADQQCGRGGQTQRAGARNDQDRYSGSEGRGCGVAGQQPRGQRGQGKPDDDRDENPGDPVGQSLNLGLAVLGVLDQACHLRQLGVRADPGGPNQQPPADVDRRANYGVPGADLDRNGLPREHRGVDGGGAAGDDAVGGDLFSGPGTEDVPHCELVGRDPHLNAVADHRDVLGAHVQQCPQGSAGALLGLGLEVASGQDEHGHHGRDLEVDMPRSALA